MSRLGVSVAEATTVDIDPVPPVRVVVIEVHAQLEMTEGAETEFVEGADRGLGEGRL